MAKKKPFEKKLLGVPTPKPVLRSVLVTDDDACLGCGNCVIVCPVNAASDPFLAAGHLNERKPLLEIVDGTVTVYDQDLCGGCGACAMICPVDAIWLERKEA